MSRMNPQGDPTRQANPIPTNNQNDVNHLLTNEPLQRLLPLSPLEQGPNTTDIFHGESLNMELGFITGSVQGLLHSNPQSHSSHPHTIDLYNSSTSSLSQSTPETDFFVSASSSETQNSHSQLTMPSIYPEVYDEFSPPSEYSDSEYDFLFNVFEEIDEWRLEHVTLGGEINVKHLKCEIFMSVDGDNPAEKKICAICREDFEDGEKIAKLDFCMHKYHVQCIEQWLLIKNQCPTCRRMGLRKVNNNENEVVA